MSKNRTRMADIASHAGVSIATVSRVFNGVGQVSDDTRYRVLTAIDELGYERPSMLADDNRLIIGVIVPELTNPIFATFAHTLHTEVDRAGGQAFIASQTPGTTSEEEHTQAFLARGVSGLIFVSGRHADLQADLSRYTNLSQIHLPFVTINGARNEVQAPDFSTEDALGIRASVQHLKELGHRKIAMLGGRHHVVPALRKGEAFRQVISQELGIPDPTVVETFYTYEAAASATHSLIDTGITAIIAGSDLQAMGAIRTIQSRGMSVPGDISVIGFDDSFLVPHLSPALTTVRQPVEAISHSAVSSLFDAIHSQKPQQHQDFAFTPDLVVRASTGRARF